MIHASTLPGAVASPVLRSARVKSDWGRRPDAPRAGENWFCAWLVLFSCRHTRTRQAASAAGFLRVWARRARDGASSGLFDKGILGAHVRPGGRQVGHLAVFGNIVRPPLSPAPPPVDQLEALAASGVERVSYREVLFRLVRTGCSAHPRASSGRSDIFIAQRPSGAVKLRRSGIARLQAGRPRLAKALHAAPTELEDGFVRLACYKYVAPTGASPNGSLAHEDPCKEQSKLHALQAFRDTPALWLPSAIFLVMFFPILEQNSESQSGAHFLPAGGNARATMRWNDNKK